MMDSYLSDEQILLRDSVERFIKQDYAFAKRREWQRSALGFAEANWQKFAAFGWLGAPFSEQDGGYGGGAVETAILMNGVGRGLVVEPYLASVVLGGGLVARLGSAEQKCRLLAPMIEGKLKLALAFTEAQSRYDLADCRTAARANGAGHSLDGKKIMVLGGDAADILLVIARMSGRDNDPDGLSAFIVDAKSPGVTITGYPTVDGQHACDVSLAGVRVDGNALLGETGGAYAPLEHVIDAATAAICAEAIGAATVLFDATLEYMKTRKQFGRPLAANQALQHRLVDMHIQLGEARAMADHATHVLEHGDPKARRRAVSAAKICVGNAMRLIGQEAIQMHGGIGMTDEYHASHYFKRLTAIGLTFGNVSFHEQRFAADGAPLN